MTTFNPRLLIPPQQEGEIYPYLRPWRSIAIEGGILFAVAFGLLFATNYLGISIPTSLLLAISPILAIAPFILWLYFTWWQERAVVQPRQRLLTVTLLSALLANAVGIPIINDFLQVDRWLPLANAVSRIIGYTFTVGIVQVFLTYIALRYAVWPQCFRIRLDGVAYGAATGVGYATVLNLQFAFANTPPPDVAALHYFYTFSVQVVIGIIIGYGLSEVRFGTPSPFLLSITIGIAALITGIAIPIHAGLTNTSLGLAESVPKPLLGLGFSAAVLIIMSLVLSFLFNSQSAKRAKPLLRRSKVYVHIFHRCGGCGCGIKPDAAVESLPRIYFFFGVILHWGQFARYYNECDHNLC